AAFSFCAAFFRLFRREPCRHCLRTVDEDPASARRRDGAALARCPPIETGVAVGRGDELVGSPRRQARAAGIVGTGADDRTVGNAPDLYGTAAAATAPDRRDRTIRRRQVESGRDPACVVHLDPTMPLGTDAVALAGGPTGKARAGRSGGDQVVGGIG